MRSTRISVYVVVSCLLAACSSPAPAPTAVPAPLPTSAPPTQPSYPGGVPPAPTSPPLGYPGSAPIAIVYQDYEIVPSTLSIRAGAPVQFVMAGDNAAAHQPYSDSAPGQFEAPSELKGGETFEFTFTQPGVVILLCKLHLEMRAALTVVP